MRRRKKQNYNQNGFSLVEVLLAIVILALVATPILQIFVSSMNISNDSRRFLGATEIGQAVLEQLNSTTVDDDSALREQLGNAATNIHFMGANYAVLPISPPSSHSNFVNGILRVSMLNHSTNACPAECASDEVYFAYHDVDHNGYKYDVVVSLVPDSATSGNDFFVYHAYVEVYSVDKKSTKHYDELLVKLDGAVFNKR